MNTKGDANRRVRITKENFRTALITLMKEKPINEITVCEIAELADVSRGTFYVYYNDVFDMVEQFENQLIDRFEEIMGQVDECSAESLNMVMLKTFTIFKENHELCEVLLGENGNLGFVNKFRKILYDPINNNLGKALNDGGATVSLFISFIINGFIGLSIEWLKSGMKESPEKMSSILSNILTNAKFMIIEETNNHI